MAHFAKIGIDNIVIETARVDNITCMDEEGVFSELKGLEYLRDLTGHESWVRCSFNTRGGVNINTREGVNDENRDPPLRKNFPSAGWKYSSDLDAFLEPDNGFSWDINPDTGLREAPVPYPDDDLRYTWDDKSQSWVELPRSEWYV
tara:strand:- start:135 stop:572 length:438 start_codon:yes stop_codon:yes gene_type:complete